MKITLVSSYFPTSAGSYRGHSAFHTLNSLRHLADIHVVCPLTTYPLIKGKGPEKPDLSYKPAGMEVSYVLYPGIPMLTRPVNGLTCEHRIESLVIGSKPDVILNYWLYPDGLAAVRLGRRSGVPVVVGSIGSDLRCIPDPITRRLTRKTLHDATQVITVSEDLRQNAIALGAAPEKVTTILNGCDTSVFHAGSRDEARRRVGCEPDVELILFVGTLLATKGLGELAEAFAGLARPRPAARLAIIGAGPYGAAMTERLAAAGVADRVRFLGRQPSQVVADWLRAADVFCLPSYSEGCPNVVVEALACGRPVVGTEVGGIPELVKDGCGLLVPPRQAEPLRAALDRALSQTWDTGRILGFQRGWDAVARETLAVCRKAIDQASVNGHRKAERI